MSIRPYTQECRCGTMFSVWHGNRADFDAQLQRRDWQHGRDGWLCPSCAELEEKRRAKRGKRNRAARRAAERLRALLDGEVVEA